MIVLTGPEKGKLCDDLGTSMEEGLAVLCMDLESEEEVFGGGERNVGATSPDDDVEEGGEEAKDNPP